MVINTFLNFLSLFTALDHTRILGSTVEDIAQKKAGIFKSGVPALVGPGCPTSVLHVCINKMYLQIRWIKPIQILDLYIYIHNLRFVKIFTDFIHILSLFDFIWFFRVRYFLFLLCFLILRSCTKIIPDLSLLNTSFVFRVLPLWEVLSFIFCQKSTIEIKRKICITKGNQTAN